MMPSNWIGRIHPKRALSLILHFRRRMTSIYRKHFTILFYRGVEFGAGPSFESRVRIEATDGGKIIFGRNVAIESDVGIVARGGLVNIEDNVFIGRGTTIVSQKEIQIGADSLIAEYVTIRDQNYNISVSKLTRLSGCEKKSIFVETNVWIGAKASILAGVRVGKNSVVGAGAIVTRDIRSGVVVSGVPARFMRNISDIPVEKF